MLDRVTYTIYRDFDPELKVGFQIDSGCDCFGCFGDVYEMVINYYRRHPEPHLKIIIFDDYSGQMGIIIVGIIRY